jgi:hypothetical protein
MEAQDLLRLRQHPAMLDWRKTGTTVGGVPVNFLRNTTWKTSWVSHLGGSTNL